MSQSNASLKPQYVLGPSTTVERKKALCMNESCNWRYASRETITLHVAAEAHALATGHTIEIVESERTALRGRRAVSRSHGSLGPTEVL